MPRLTRSERWTRMAREARAAADMQPRTTHARRVMLDLVEYYQNLANRRGRFRHSGSEAPIGTGV